MGDLKPIGSEKLTGMEKINRILELSRYKESIPTPINELNSSEYKIKLADGMMYEISKDKNGYVIKKGINESELDYIEPMKNRKYYSSYSQAFKRLNLITKEVNTLYEATEGQSLFSEQKKYVLKTPTPAPAVTEPTPAPAPVSSPESASAVTDDLDMSDLGGEDSMGDMDNDMSDLGGEDSMDDMNNDMPDLGGDIPEHGMATMKTIQKLTGKLAQKIRTLESGENPMSSKDIKYVVNSILSALDINKLEDDDKEEILSRFDSDEFSDSDYMDMAKPKSPMNDFDDLGDDEESDDEETSTEMGEDFERELSTPTSPYVRKFEGNHNDDEDRFIDDMVENIFSESKIDKIINSYLIFDKKEKKNNNTIDVLAESEKQAKTTKTLMKENVNAIFLGKTNLKNLLVQIGNQKVKVAPNGKLI
jgi:hypothetical protein